jgi:hypothetical protein
VNGKDTKRLRADNVLRRQMLKSRFKDAMQSAEPPVPTDEAFTDLLDKLEQAERKQQQCVVLMNGRAKVCGS